MSRNSDRLAAPLQSIGAVHSGAETMENNIGYVRSTFVVDLPSEGKLYPADHPLHDVASLELKEMTAREEDILMSRTLVQKGVVLDKLLESLMTVRVDPSSLLVGDKNALLVATRIAAYGANYTVKDVTCQYCLAAVDEYTFDLNALKTRRFSEILEDLPAGVRFDDNLFYIVLPKTQLEIGCKILTGKEEELISRTIESRKKHALQEMTLIENMRSFFVSINGNTDRGVINQFLVGEGFPSSDSLHLRTTYAKLIPNIDMHQTYACTTCGYEKEVVVPITAQFFWPN